MSEEDSNLRLVRLIVARCEVSYTGRGSTRLAEGVRLVMIKEDGTVMLWSDGGGLSVKPLNWMTPPTIVEGTDAGIVVRKRAGKSEDRLEIRLVEVLSDVSHDMGESAALRKDGVERDLQAELAARPDVLGDGLRLVRREWATDIGPVDLMCRDDEGAWIAVEIKRVGTIEAVEQLSRYLERLELEGCRGMLAAQAIKPQARTLAEGRGIRCVEVDLELLRGEREPELTLFGVA
jgi:RecB family endonuclease NucS